MANNVESRKRKRDDSDDTYERRHRRPSCMFTHDYDSELHSAIKSADITAIQNLLTNGHILCHGVRNNCFMLAARTGGWEILKLLLQHDPSGVNIRDCNGRTLLMCLKDFKAETIPYLLELGYDLSALDVDGKNLLMYAVTNINFPIKDLLEYDININMRDNKGRTALMHAAMDVKSANVETVKALLKAGADPDILDNNHYSPLLRSLKFYFRNCKITHLLLKAGSATDQKKHKILHVAWRIFISRSSNMHMVKKLRKLFKKLIKAGANLFAYSNKKSLLKCIFEDIRNMKQWHLLVPFISDMFKTTAEQMLHKKKQLSFEDYPQMLVMRKLLYKYIKQIDIFWPAIHKLLQPKYMNQTGECGVHERNFYIYYSMYKKLVFYQPLKYDTVSWFVEVLAEHNFPQLPIYLEKLLHNGFQLTSYDPEIISLVTVLMKVCFKKRTQDQELLQMLYFFISKGISASQTIFNYDRDDLEELRSKLCVPDCVLLALMSSRTECLRALLPYWSGHPMSLLPLLLETYEDWNHWQIEELRNTIKAHFTLLAELGGPICDFGTQCRITDKLEIWSNKDPVFLSISNEFKEMHSEVPSLRVLCKTFIRSRMKSGNNLPEKLASLVPPGLKEFISLQPLAVRKLQMNEVQRC